ncbi:hypothetical protein H0H92_013801, partial [Tricholoma furcatifolium]
MDLAEIWAQAGPGSSYRYRGEDDMEEDDEAEMRKDVPATAEDVATVVDSDATTIATVEEAANFETQRIGDTRPQKRVAIPGPSRQSFSYLRERELMSRQKASRSATIQAKKHKAEMKEIRMQMNRLQEDYAIK